MSKIWICLFRGINVGGNNKLPMKDLTRVMLAAGFTDVKTYIASGNVVFKYETSAFATPEEDLGYMIEMYVERDFGFRPRALVLSLEHLEKILAANPFKDYEHKGKAQHIFLPFSSTIRADLAILESLKAPSEAFHLGDHAFYLYAPEGIGRSKLAEKLDRALKTATTARNLNTVETLRDMAADLEK
jgi:uncharacterized protein (DUF1697 family)